MIVALILLIAGVVTKFGPFLMFGGLLFLLMGLLGFSGIEREVDWDVLRNEADQNRVQRLDTATETIIGSPSTETPPPNTRFDIGVWYVSWIFLIGGLFTTLFSFFLIGQWIDEFFARRRGM